MKYSFDEFLAVYPEAYRGCIKIRNSREETQIDLSKKRSIRDHLFLMLEIYKHIEEGIEKAKANGKEEVKNDIQCIKNIL